MLFQLFFYPIRTVFRALRDIHDWITYLAMIPFPREYQRFGSCKGRGVCCKSIGVYLSAGFWKRPVLKKLAVFWYTLIYHFEYVSEDADLKVISFSCRYLKGTSCSIHWRRPMICRVYPAPRFFGKPAVLPGCGYRFKK